MSVLGEDCGIWFRNEADIRDGIAASGYLSGWDARVEVPAGSGARADVVLSVDRQMIVVEVKVDLLTTRQLRLAFQQVEGYRRFFEAASGRGNECNAYLTAGHIDWELARPFMDTYFEVDLLSLGHLQDRLRTHFITRHARARVIAFRRRDVDRVSRLLHERQRSLAEDARRSHLVDLHGSYPALAQTLALAVGLTFEPAA